MGAIRPELTESDRVHSTKLPRIVDCYWGRHLNNLDPLIQTTCGIVVVIPTPPTRTGRGTNPGFDDGYVPHPLTNSNEGGTQVWCFPEHRSTGALVVCALRVGSEGQLVQTEYENSASEYHLARKTNSSPGLTRSQSD